MPTCRCAQCRELFVVDEAALGKKTECPHCNNLVYVPGQRAEEAIKHGDTPAPSSPPTSRKHDILFYYKLKGEEKGPYTLGQLHSLWNTGIITADTSFRENESQEWQPISRLIEREQVTASAKVPQPPSPQSDVSAPAPAPPKPSVPYSKRVAEANSVMLTNTQTKNKCLIAGVIVVLTATTCAIIIMGQKAADTSQANAEDERARRILDARNRAYNPLQAETKRPQSGGQVGEAQVVDGKSIQTICDEYDSNPVRANEKHAGKLFRCKGKVIRIDELSISLQPEGNQFGFPQIYCMLPRSERAILSSLDKGQEIDVVGNLMGATKYEFLLSAGKVLK